MLTPEEFKSLVQRAHAEFPSAFPDKGEPARPLAFCVREALRTAWPDQPVVKFLRCYCGGPGYLKAIAAGGPRYKLDGSVEGEVSSAEQADAARRLEALKQRREQKQAA